VGFDDDPPLDASRHPAIHSPVPRITATAIGMIADGPVPGARIVLPAGPLTRAGVPMTRRPD
jgi:hypothetical protein